MATGKPLPRYDVTFEWDGHQQGSMIATEKGKPLYMDNYTKPTLPQYITDVATLQSKPPEQEIPIVQKYFHGGYGQHLFEDLTKYLYGVGVDTRFKGNVILAPKINLRRWIGYEIKLDGDIVANLESIGGGGDHYEEIYGSYHSARYVQETRQNAYTWEDIYDTEGGAADPVSSKSQSYKAWVRMFIGCVSGSTGEVRAQLICSSNGTKEYYPDGDYIVIDSEGEWIEHEYTVDPDTSAAWDRDGVRASKCGVRLWVSDGSTTARVYQGEMVRGSQDPWINPPPQQRFFEWHLDDIEDHPASPQGRFLCCRPGISNCGPARFHIDKDMFIVPYPWLGYYIYDSVQFDNDLFTAKWNPYGDQHYDSSPDFYRISREFDYSPDGDVDLFHKFQQYLWAVYLPNIMRYTDDPAHDPGGSGIWSLVTAIGDASMEITETCCFQDKLIVGKEDTAYYIDQSHNVVDMFSDFKLTAHPDNFKRMRSYKGKLIMPVMINRLYEYDGTTVRDISPASYAPSLTEYSGKIIDLATDGDWLYVLTQEATGSHPFLIAGREEIVDGVLDWHWHVLAELTDLSEATAIVVTQYTSNNDNLELWVHGLSQSTTGVIWLSMVLPRWGTPWEDDNCEFESSGDLYTSWFSTDFENMEKMLFYFMLFAENLNNASGNERSITVSWQFEGEDWEVLHKFDDPDLAFEKVNFPLGKRGVLVRFKFTLATDDNDYTPRLEQFICSCRLGSSDLRQFDMFLKLTEFTSLKEGIGEGTKAKDLYDAIYTIKERNAPFYFYDYPYGEKMLVTMVSPSPEKVIVEEENGKFELALHVQLMEANQ